MDNKWTDKGNGRGTQGKGRRNGAGTGERITFKRVARRSGGMDHTDRAEGEGHTQGGAWDAVRRENRFELTSPKRQTLTQGVQEVVTRHERLWRVINTPMDVLRRRRARR